MEIESHLVLRVNLVISRVKADLWDGVDPGP